MNSSADISTNHQSKTKYSDLNKSIESKEKKEQVGSPSKKHRSQPVMRSPEKKKNIFPDLPLPELPKSDESDDLVFEQFKSPSRTSSFRSRSVKSPSGANNSPTSTVSPRSPRSPRNEHETMSSRRHRIESPRSSGSVQQQASVPLSPQSVTVTTTVAQTVTSTLSTSHVEDTSRRNTNTVTNSARQRLSSPPGTVALNQPSAEQMDAFADLWIQTTVGSSSGKSGDRTSLLTVGKINALGRTDGKIDVLALPSVLGGLKVSADKQGKVSLSNLLNSLLANHLGQSETGKTIRAMQVTAMHDNPNLASISFEDMMEIGDAGEEKKLRQRMADAIVGQARACVDVAFGKSGKLSGCHLPQPLLDFWQMLDAKLVKEAAKNPALTPTEILTARSNLGFDLLVTRQMYPFTLKPAQAKAGTEVTSTRTTSDTALPVLSTVFANSVREAAVAAWPAFFNDAIASFDA
jgi:hypothetical protein